jgi:hypothetical protein
MQGIQPTVEDVKTSFHDAINEVLGKVFWADGHLSDIEDGDLVEFRGHQGIITNVQIKNNKRVQFFMYVFETGEEKGHESAPLSSIRLGVLPQVEEDEVSE